MADDVDSASLELGPAAPYEHDHPPVRNPIAEHWDWLTPGQRIADRVAALVGSWPFLIVQSVILFLWMAVNGCLVVHGSLHPGSLHAGNPYPFILLNLVPSFQAAYTGPVVMMAQNRQAETDRSTTSRLAPAYAALE